VDPAAVTGFVVGPAPLELDVSPAVDELPPSSDVVVELATVLDDPGSVPGSTHAFAYVLEACSP
jgi:hypothetical protein